MASSFDAELCLRLAGERAILDPTGDDDDDFWDGTPFYEVADALAAIGGLKDETLDAIVEDYQLALSLRGDGDDGPMLRRFRSSPSPPTFPPPPPLTVARVAALDEDIDEPWGRVRVFYIALGDRSTSVAFSAVETPPSPPRGGGPGMWHHRGPPGLQDVPLRDDQGTTVIANTTRFGGQPQQGTWRGVLSGGPLSPRTRWIDFHSTRLELPPAPEPPPVRIERVPGSLAERYLRLRLASRSVMPMPPKPKLIEAAIEALIAAGAVNDDDPILTECRAVTGSSTQAISDLPEPWASLRGRQRSSGPSGTVPIGLVTPPVDGISIGIEALVCTDDYSEFRTSTTPSVGLDGRTRIAWWAEDDQGNHYLGGPGSWGGGATGSGGEIRFGPLDPQATELRIIPTGLTERAVITLKSLPWTANR